MKKIKGLELFDLGSGRKIPVETLKELLPSTEVALFFAKAYNLDAWAVGNLLRKVFKTELVDALTNGEHSTELQEYIGTLVAEDTVERMEWSEDPIRIQGEILPELWKQAELTIAQSIKDVAKKLAGTLHLLPSKQGSMVFKTMMTMNRNRPTIGDYRATIQHEQVPDVLVILDVSGSMTENTIRTIVDDVVALSWEANAWLAIVSNSCFVWEPGSYSSEDVLAKAEYGGTDYTQLFGLFQKDWDTVVTIADYDSYLDARAIIAQAPGDVGQVFDISLVNKPTFLSEVVGQLAGKVTPLMVAADHARLAW